MFAIFKRELASYFTSPVGYVVTAAFMVFNGIFFYVQCLYTGTSNMYGVFQSMFFIVLFALMWGGALNGVLSTFTDWLNDGISWLARLPFKPFVS